MRVGVYYVESTNVLGDSINQGNRQLVTDLAKLTGYDFSFTTLETINDYDFVLDFIGGGGTEGRFLQVIDKVPHPIFLLTTGANNSLAASMEILSYLQQNFIEGEIIHGSLNKMAARIQVLAKVFEAKKKLRNFTIGRVGKPSDWLISSEVNNDLSKSMNGITIVDIDMQEFFNEIKKKEYEKNSFTDLFLSKDYDNAEKEKALYIYGALKRICTKYHLQGVTVRCFDLLQPIKGTGCIALAILNAEGIYASCEGDTPALISMAILGSLTGQPIFMANPSRIDTDTNTMVFAHCTLPINMPYQMEYMTHFESGLGVAIRGKIKEGPITVFKCDGLLTDYFVSSGELEENLTEANLCRTQIKVKMEDVNYFLTQPIGNHHLICQGNYVELVSEFFNWDNNHYPTI